MADKNSASERRTGVGFVNGTVNRGCDDEGGESVLHSFGQEWSAARY